MTVKPAPSPESIALITTSSSQPSAALPTQTPDSLPKLPLTREETIAQAQELIIAELIKVVARDVREKIITKRIIETIEDYRVQTKNQPNRSLLPAIATTAPAVEDPIVAPLRAFKFTKKASAMKPPPVKKRSAEELETEDTVAASDTETVGMDVVVTIAPKHKEKPAKKRRKIRAVVAEEEEPEEALAVESEDEDGTVIAVVPQRPAKVDKRKHKTEDEPVKPTKKRKTKKAREQEEREQSFVPVPQVERAGTVDIAMSELEDDVELEPPPPAKRRAPLKPTTKPRPVTPPPPPDPFLLGLVDPIDDEELYFLRQGLTRRKVGLALVDDEGAHLAAPPKRHPALRGNTTGSARTEGYYKIPEAAKSLYMPDRNKATVEVPQTRTTVVPQAGQSSRSNRVNSRKLVQGMEQANKYLTQLGGSDAVDNTLKLKFNQLRTRKKKLKFSRSPIHDWGLYAMEGISQGEMVIEYVGEVIRQQVADKREKYYERTGIGSSYLFRVDDDAVVDATKKGNLGLVDGTFIPFSHITNDTLSDVSSTTAAHRTVPPKSLPSMGRRKSSYTRRATLNLAMKSRMVSE